MNFKAQLKHKIIPLRNAKEKVSLWKSKDLKVVFTNGVFDLIHPGHVDYLASARDLGDKLIIGLNSDASAKLLNKGPARPIQTEQARALVLAGFGFVDAIVIFNEPTPQQLIKALLPSVLVKGGDYKKADIVGAQEVEANGGEVSIIPFLEGYSTTSIEQKIKQAAGIG